MSNNNIISKGSKFNLIKLYGAESLPEMDGKFRTYKEINNFMKDYSYNNNKSTCIKIVGYDKEGRPRRASGGDRVVYVCTDSECDFLAFWRRKKKSNGFFNLIEHKPHNGLCNSQLNPSYSQLAQLPSFKSAIKSSSHPTKKSVITSALENDRINLFNRTKIATVYKAMTTAKSVQSPPNYELIESFFVEILKLNAQVRCALEVSLDSSFLSAFMSNVREGGLPVFCFDASHSKHPEYSGKHFVLLKKLATKKFISLCYAVAPAEDVMYLSWFFYACVKSGVDLSTGVVFVDRGHARSAISLLSKCLKIKVNLKYCTIHIIRNFATKFGYKETDVNVRAAIFRLQQSSSAAEYIEHGSAIEDAFGTDAMIYLCRNIHPTNWVVFGNNKNANSELKKLPEWVGAQDPYKEGWPAPLFGCRSTNGAEGENNGMIHNDVRNCLPFESLNIVLKKWSRNEVERALLCRTLLNMDGDFVEDTKNIINNQLEVSRRYECEIMSMSLNEISHLTVTSGNSSHRYVVDILKRECSCSFFEQFHLPCCHVFAAKAFCSREKFPFPPLTEYSNSEYLKTSFISSHSKTSLSLPTTDYIQIHEIKAPPYKRCAGRPCKKARYKSRSESVKSTVKTVKFCSKCKMVGHNTRTCKVVNPGLTTANKTNSSYGTTYVGNDVSIFSSKIFKNVAEVNTDTFKSSLESHSVYNMFEKEDSDVDEVESSVVNGSFVIFYVIIFNNYSLFACFSKKEFSIP